MIQGKWQLVEASHTMEEFDTAFIDYEQEKTILIFEGNKCSQYMPSWGDTLEFTFDIHNFRMTIFSDTAKVNTFDIIALTADSLILNDRLSLRKYKKTE